MTGVYRRKLLSPNSEGNATDWTLWHIVLSVQAGAVWLRHCRDGVRRREIAGCLVAAIACRRKKL